MSDDITPTTEDVKRSYRNHLTSAYHMHSDISNGQFDRWLAEHDRKVVANERERIGTVWACPIDWCRFNAGHEGDHEPASATIGPDGN